MAIHVVSIWVYSFCPIDLTPIISEFFARCRSSNLRIEHSVQLAHYDDIAPETKNKIQRMTVVHKSVGQEKRDLGVNLKNVAYLTVGKYSGFPQIFLFLRLRNHSQTKGCSYRVQLLSIFSF